MRLNGNLSTNSDHGESRVIRQIQYSLDIATELIKGGTVIAAKIEVHFRRSFWVDQSFRCTWVPRNRSSIHRFLCPDCSGSTGIALVRFRNLSSDDAAPTNQVSYSRTARTVETAYKNEFAVAIFCIFSARTFAQSSSASHRTRINDAAGWASICRSFEVAKDSDLFRHSSLLRIRRSRGCRIGRNVFANASGRRCGTSLLSNNGTAITSPSPSTIDAMWKQIVNGRRPGKASSA